MGSWLGQTGVEILELVNVRDRGWMRRMMDHGWDGGGIYLIPSRARRRPRDWQGARVIGVFRRFGTSTGSIDGIKICPIRHLVTVEQSRSCPGSRSPTVPFFSLSLSSTSFHFFLLNASHFPLSSAFRASSPLCASSTYRTFENRQSCTASPALSAPARLSPPSAM